MHDVIDIFLDDLTEFKKNEILNRMGYKRDYDTIPLAQINIDDNVNKCPNQDDRVSSKNDCKICVLSEHFHLVGGICYLRDEDLKMIIRVINKSTSTYEVMSLRDFLDINKDMDEFVALALQLSLLINGDAKRVIYNDFHSGEWEFEILN